MVDWRWYTFEQLDIETLYSIVALRELVFVLEQRCTYQDVDGRDQTAWHLLGTVNGELSMYLRVLPPTAYSGHENPSIGRVVTQPEFRKQGLASAAMAEAIRFTREKFPYANIRVAAQSHLEKFYAKLGFVPIGQQYVEDGIPHKDMSLSAQGPNQISNATDASTAKTHN